MSNNKKQTLFVKIKNTCIVIISALVVYYMHSILSSINNVLPFPIILGMIGGFLLGIVYNFSQKKNDK